MEQEFLVYIDASKEELGGVLVQEGRPISYASRKLRPHEENYVTHDLEPTTIVYALKVWRHYLVNRKFELKTDHHRLPYIFTQSNLNVRKKRWSDMLSEYDFKILYIKGMMNKAVDAMSR